MVNRDFSAGRSTPTTAQSSSVPLGENDRFLTLAATDGGDGIDCDWIVFGDPRLELLLTATENGTEPQPK